MGLIGRGDLICFRPFESMDRRPQPGAKRLFDLLLCPGTIQRLERFPVRRQGNMRARNLFLARALGDELHQQALLARFAILRIKVHASGGILENKSRSPGLARQSTVTTLLEEFQLELQYIQQFAIILWHNLTRQR